MKPLIEIVLLAAATDGARRLLQGRGPRHRPPRVP